MSYIPKVTSSMNRSGKIFDIGQRSSFYKDLYSVPKKVQNSFEKKVLHELESNPFQTPDLKIKKLKGYKNYYRYRIANDYRLVYTVDQHAQIIELLILDNRRIVYDRLGVNEDGTPSIRITANSPEILEHQPSIEDQYHAKKTIALSAKNEEVSSLDAKKLPMSLTLETLNEWGIPTGDHEALKSVTTEGELLAAQVSKDILEQVMNRLYPKSIEEVLQEPVRTVNSIDSYDRKNTPIRPLESFLLRLDDEQLAYVSRFNKIRPTGPWLLKGGPGSGKSTIALYCIKKIMDNANSELQLDDKPLRILFTTFTNSLTNASLTLLKLLGRPGGKHIARAKNVNTLLKESVPGKSILTPDLKHFLKKEFTKRSVSDPKFSFSTDDVDFIAREIEWVICGQGLTALETYLTVDRSGQRRVLGQNQRRQVWSIYQEFEKFSKVTGILPVQQALLAVRDPQLASECGGKYDYVFIDEAQDLPPAVIRFCVHLCNYRSNVFLTADLNQSIYGTGMSWSKVAKELNFQGKARILRRNYRCTREIWDAITQLAPDTEESDRETLDVDVVYKGSGGNPYPLLFKYSREGSVVKRLNNFLHEALMLERVTSASSAVLCRTNKIAEKVARLIDKKFNAKYMSSKELDLSHPGVKVLTMHASKGLQFPVVAIVNVEEDVIPLFHKGTDSLEHYANERRLFFVAASRAMRRLAVFASKAEPSRFIKELSDEYWEIEEEMHG